MMGQDRRRTLPAVVVVVTVAALLALACGSGNKEAKTTPAPAVTQAAAAPTSTTGPAAAASSTGAAPSGQAKQAQIGAVFSLTGSAAAYGATQKNGAELAVSEINSNNTVPGVKINLTVEDDASDRNQGITAFNKLINANVTAIMGPTLSNTAQATDPIAQDKKVPVLGVSNTAEGITSIGDYIFRDSLTEADVIPQTVKKVADKLKPKKAALMYANDDAFSKSGADAMRAALKANNIDIATEQVFSTKDTDFRAQLTNVKNANPDVIFVSCLIDPAVGVVTQARELGLRQPIAGGNGFNSPQLIKQAGDASEGVIVGAAWNQASQNPLSVKFVQAYKAKYNSDPDQFAAQAYTGVYILANAIKSAESLDHAAIRDALTKINNLDTVLGTFSFTKDRDAQHPAVVQIVKGGKYTVWE